MKTLWLSAAVVGLVSGPAWAGCADDLAMMEAAVITAETGASTDPSGMEPTKHQQEVLSKDKTDKPAADAETTASTGAEVEATTSHQKEVTGQKGGKDPAQTMKEASELAKAGNEAGCMQKLTELKAMLGQK